MSETTLSWIDKSSWAAGPWQQEPDKIEFRDEATGLPCIIRRNDHIGFLCGYVGVPPGHPAYGVDYEKLESGVDVHGGLSFGRKCAEEEKERGICHVPQPGESDDVYWLGFDCGHTWDQWPGKRALAGEHFPEVPADTYRDVEYVRGECRNLARQLAAMK